MLTLHNVGASRRCIVIGPRRRVPKSLTLFELHFTSVKHFPNSAGNTGREDNMCKNVENVNSSKQLIYTSD